MKAVFEKKRLMEVCDINAKLARPAQWIDHCEAQYAQRVAAVGDAIQQAGASIVMLSGPSASGKTTSAHKIALEMKKRGHGAVVVSLDNFFKNIENYPQTADGKPDLEHLHAVDVTHVNHCLSTLIETGACEIPVFDFITEHRTDETLHIVAGDGDIVIIEGIHALNPAMASSVPAEKVFNVYVGLRGEYSVAGQRVVATRDLRITRRMVRDFYYRGHSVARTLEMWQRLMDGEEKWIKPFKKDANMLLDTTFEYEPCLFAPLLQRLCADAAQGGAYRAVLLEINERFCKFEAICADLVPKNSLLREFVGGLELEG
jgi:uridine kinase